MYPINISKILVSFIVTIALATSLSAQITILDNQFDDMNPGGSPGVNLSNTTNAGVTASNTEAGTVGGKWNFGSYTVSNREIGGTDTGVLNFGYTNFYKTTDIDQSTSGTNNLTRKFVFTDGTPGTWANGDYDNSDAITSSDFAGDYQLIMDVRRYDFRQIWDNTDNATSSSESPSAAQKGIMFRVIGSNGNETITAYTQGTSGFRIAGQLSGEAARPEGVTSSYAQINGGQVTGGSLGRYSADGMQLRFAGNLGTGDFTMAVKNNNGSGDWDIINTGVGLTSISAIALAGNSPSVGAWGGAYDNSLGDMLNGDPSVGGNSGDYAWINSITMTAVPEPSSYALIAGCLAMTAIMLRRRF
jgi:hypothetical protein